MHVLALPCFGVLPPEVPEDDEDVRRPALGRHGTVRLGLVSPTRLLFQVLSRQSYVYVCVYIYISIHIYIYMYIHLYLCECMYVCMHVCITSHRVWAFHAWFKARFFFRIWVFGVWGFWLQFFGSYHTAQYYPQPYAPPKKDQTKFN